MPNTVPTRGAAEPTTTAWSARPGVARMLRAAVFLLPVAASWTVTRALSSWFWRPVGPIGTTLWLVQLISVGTAVVVATGRVARRLLPLAALYSLTIAFPDQAPSRFRVALRSGNVRAMQDQFADVRANGFATDRATATNQILELIAALSRHEPRTRGHTDRVRAYTEIIAEEMGLPAEDREKLRWATMMHDIGKLAVPAAILNKPGKPTDEEWQTLKTHPVVGGELVEPLADWLGDWRFAASQHHERWDGGGYPCGLAGEAISLSGRIVAVADAYDVITSARSYKKPMSAEAARRELVRCAGSQFDPTVVRAFLHASIGTRTTRAGAIGWLLEAPRVFAAAASNAAGSAGAVVAASTIAAASVAVTAPPVEPPTGTPTEVAAAQAGDPAGVDVVVSRIAAESRTWSVAGPIATGPVVTVSSGVRGAAASGAAGATTTTRPVGTSATSAPAAGATGTTDAGTTGAPPSTSVPGDAPTGAAPTTTTPMAPTTTTAAATTACDALNAGETQLAGADLAGCVVKVRKNQLIGVDLHGANLQGASLNGMTIDGGSLAGADLTGATLNGVTFQNLDMRNAVLTNANLGAATIQDNDLTGASITGARLNGSQWYGNDLTGATFAGATGKPSKAGGNTWSSTTCVTGPADAVACF